MHSGRNSIFSSAAIFIVLEIAAVAMIRHSDTSSGFWLDNLSHKVSGNILGRVQNTKDYFSLRAIDRNLAEENAELTVRLMQLSDLEDSVLAAGSLKAPEGPFSYTFASVIKYSTNRQRNYIILDKGSADGIEPQSGIVTSKGAIGIVEEVEEHCSFGLMIMNPKISVSARIGREGLAAPLFWDGKSKGGWWLKGLPVNYQLDRDTVYTSGYSELFPAGIPIGVVSGEKKLNGATANVEVDLFQDMDSIRYTLIAKPLWKDEITRLEKKGGLK